MESAWLAAREENYSVSTTQEGKENSTNAAGICHQDFQRKTKEDH
jgi:hypothetical protein